MAEPKASFPKMPSAQKQSNKSASTNTSAAKGGKMGQADGHKADVARLANKLPVK